MACGAPSGQGGDCGPAGRAYNAATSPTAQETRFEFHAMPKRSRVPRDNLLGALDEEEVVLETQPELLNTILAEDEDGRRIKKQKREHYRPG